MITTKYTKCTKSTKVFVPSWLNVCFVAACILAGVTVSAAQDSPPSGNIENGRKAYLKTGCYQCHGREGQGSPTTGPRLGPGPAPFRAFSAWVRSPRGEMPPYTVKVLSDAELADIYAYLASRAKPAPVVRQ